MTKTALFHGAILACAAFALSFGAPPAAACPMDPYAWVTPCMEPQTQTVTVYDVEQNPATTRVCPLLGICVDVPQPGSLLVPREETVTYFVVHVHVNQYALCYDLGQIAGEPACAAPTGFAVTPGGQQGLVFQQGGGFVLYRLSAA